MMPKESHNGDQVMDDDMSLATMCMIIVRNSAEAERRKMKTVRAMFQGGNPYESKGDVLRYIAFGCLVENLDRDIEESKETSSE